ncbi:MAG TPA: DNA gyrase C-terminal beta-propeller domain-containing protein [Chloroflexota bacterium]|nr:DNA gyrase C-terminal beta-propeller domain-containing protein [Chloroflexota bacterium]
MELERPDLSQVAPEVVAYIEALEAELAKFNDAVQPERTPEPQEPPTTINVISLSQHGRAKRTPRHFYGRQRRAGMGVFDLETTPPFFPAHLALADEEGHLLLISNHGRAFRLPVNSLVETPVRAAGSLALGSLSLRENEQIAGILPADSGKYLVMVSQRGWVQRVRDGYLGKSLINGMSFHNVKEGGLITAVCWTQGDGDLFIATRQGKGIRFRESQASERGCLGLRVELGDEVAAVTAVYPHSRVFMITHDGKGTVRQMETFAANKAPGAGGKAVMKTEKLIGALTVNDGDDLFIISQLGKIIRFPADDVPAKEGAVQGVNCMALRNDEVTAVTITKSAS